MRYLKQTCPPANLSGDLGVLWRICRIINVSLMAERQTHTAQYYNAINPRNLALTRGPECAMCMGWLEKAINLYLLFRHSDLGFATDLNNGAWRCPCTFHLPSPPSRGWKTQHANGPSQATRAVLGVMTAATVNWRTMTAAGGNPPVYGAAGWVLGG